MEFSCIGLTLQSVYPASLYSIITVSGKKILGKGVIFFSVVFYVDVVHVD